MGHVSYRNRVTLQHERVEAEDMGTLMLKICLNCRSCSPLLPIRLLPALCCVCCDATGAR